MLEDVHAVVLVEGISDRIALEALAERRGRDLAGDGVAILPVGGAQAIGRHLDELGQRGRDLQLAGLCDADEERHVARALERAGLGESLERAGMERLGFFVCVENLEDELIRALGPAGVESVVESQGDLETFRLFQNQPAWRGRSTESQLRRWMHNGDRHLRYPPLLLGALALDRVPRPLDGVLAHV
jgi:OLD-like protein